MRLPRSFTDELRGQADILRVVSDYVTLKKRGANYLACCPFHQEKTPSFNVNPARQLFKCFGCGKAGDVFAFVMAIEGSSFPESIRTVAEKCGVPLPQEVENRDADAREQLRAELIEINRWATEFFCGSLEEGAEGQRARDYLVERGVSLETQRTFRLGYAPNSWDALSNHLKDRGATRQQIERSGLVSLRESGTGFHDRFRGRLMFPIQDAQGRVVAFGGRILGAGEPKYLNSPETALYTKGQHLFGLGQSKDAIRKKGYAVLVEGYLDFLIPFQAGVQQLVASLGTALTEQQVRLLGRYARKIVVNFDPDTAGASATKRNLEVLVSAGFAVKVLSLPDNLDPDEYIRKRGTAEYLKLLKTSQSFMDYVVEEAVKAHDQATPTGKVETINAILPYLKLVKDRIVRAESFERIADRLKIESHLIRDEFKRAANSRSDAVRTGVARAALAIKPAEQRLLEILLSHETLRKRFINELCEEDYAGLRTAEVFRLLSEFEARRQEPSYEALCKELDDEILVNELLPGLMINENGEPVESADIESLERVAAGSIHSLRCDHLAERQTVLQAEINRAQRASNGEVLNQLLMEKFALAKRERALAQTTVDGKIATR
jgi:DNA primase